MSYRAPLQDFHFLMENVSGLAAVRATDRFADATEDVCSAIVTEAGKLCEDVLAPLNRFGDQNPAVLENGVVRMAPGFPDAYRKLAEGGWTAINAHPDHGGMGLPLTLTTAVNEMMAGACLAMQINPLMTQGQIEALEAHADDSLKAIYLPKLISGEWTGTMNLTEPQAGSDVGALSTKAEPQGDGTYALSGQKIYISYGDHDMAENICHLVLARLPDAPAGTKGISLFMVPKRLPDAEGNAGVANAIKVVSLEHKLGLHASPTAVMQYDGATGWLVGQPNKGMAAMFTMMNNARLGVGVQGIGVAEAATQKALAYAMERKQGRAGGTGTIVEHADVRRMLTTMRAETYAARAIALANAAAIDMSNAGAGDDWTVRAAFLTPITKAYGTETGINVASMGIQVHGGMGYVEETGAAQFLRDVRVSAIYEGTNGIQAMDLVARKMMDGGEAAFRLLEEIEAGAEAARATLPEMADAVWRAGENLREATDTLLAQDLEDRFAGAMPYLTAWARVLGGHYHLASAVASGGTGPRCALARFFITRVLPDHVGLLEQARAGAGDLFALSPEDLAVA